MRGILFDSLDSGGSGKIVCQPGFTLGDRQFLAYGDIPFFQTPQNALSQIVLPVTLDSHFLYNDFKYIAVTYCYQLLSILYNIFFSKQDIFQVIISFCLALGINQNAPYG